MPHLDPTRRLSMGTLLGVTILAIAGMLSIGYSAAQSVSVFTPRKAAPATTVNSNSLVKELASTISKDMVDIPSGTFVMGDLGGKGEADERPAREVTVRAFRLARHEVTFDQYDAYAVLTRRALPSDQGHGRGRHPVTFVSWTDAQAFIKWLNHQTGLKYRLPTEAEWEYAARAGSQSDFPWGARFDPNLANSSGTSGRDQYEFTAPVGSFPPNPWGLFDMIGNVWEMTQDCWHETYEGAPKDGSAWTSPSCTVMSNRGGSWYRLPTDLRVSNRFAYGSTSLDDSLGFRLAHDQ